MGISKTMLTDSAFLLLLLMSHEQLFEKMQRLASHASEEAFDSLRPFWLVAVMESCLVGGN